MKPQPKMRYAGAFAVLLALLAVLFVWNVNSGSLHLSVREVAQILLTHSGDNAVIVWEIRLPRIFAAILLGGLSPAFCCRPFSPTRSRDRSCWVFPRVPS